MIKKYIIKELISGWYVSTTRKKSVWTDNVSSASLFHSYESALERLSEFTSNGGNIFQIIEVWI